MTLALHRPVATATSRAVAALDDGRLPVRLLGLWLALLLLIPDRFTLPKGANVAVRPHHAVLAVLLVVLFRRFAQGEPVRFGRSVVVLALPAVAALSLLRNLGNLGAAETAAGMRAFGEVTTLALVVLLTVATAPNRRQRRSLVGLVVALLLVGSFLGFWEAATGTQALDGLDRAIPVLGVETFSATGARAANPFVGGNVPFQQRLGMNRVAGASRHAIEFSVVMCFGVILAVALAVGANRLGRRAAFLAAAASMAVALPLALARTGVVGAVVASVVAIAVARRKLRTAALIGIAAGVLIAGALSFQPKATDGLVHMFVTSREDTSVQARTSDYREIDRAVGTDPWIGRGIGQWETYRTPFDRQLLFDNQYLLSAEETGLFGVLALVAIFITAISAAVRWTRVAGPERPLAVAVLGAVVAFVVVSAMFDSLYFSQAASLFMFFFGLSCVAVLEAGADA
ncbi:MAG: hypothetical protein JWN29_2328 [Acidimicrobiales bacterium]|nr:hypothetical protein [Acidimicrobiales bacterium]